MNTCIMAKLFTQSNSGIRNLLFATSGYYWITWVLLLTALSVIFSEVQAQSAKRTIKGTIQSAMDNKEIPGASVLVKGTAIGTTTDAKGEFTIEASDNDVLVVSFIGYITQEVKVGSRTTIDVLLPEDISILNEVVVVGYGEMKRADLSSAQTTIAAKDLEKTVNTTLEQAIQGRAANVYITQNTGQPGGGISVNIRGISSVNGTTEPLYVIDGVQISGAAGGSYGQTSSINPLAGLNPSDIETIDILQGPSATAVYGSRGTNGVVLITTKRGKSGKMKAGYAFTYSLQDRPSYLPTLNLREYAEMVNEYRSLTGNTPVPEFQDPSLLGEGTNWQKELFRQSPLVKHQLSLSGGNDKTTYYMSGEYFKQEGVVAGSAFDRYAFRLNVDNQTRKWLKLSTNIALNQTKDKVNSTQNDLISIAIEQAPNIAVRNADGSWGGPVNAQFSTSNPIALASLIDNRIRRMNALGGISADINIWKGLVFRTSLNGNAQFSNGYTFTPTYKMGSITNNTAISDKSAGNSLYWNWNQLVQYNTQIKKHSIGVMLSHEAQESWYENLSGARSGFLTNNLTELSLGDAKTATNTSTRGSWALESYLGRLNYSFADKYYFQAAFRADGSINFGANKRWGYFPSASVAWRISQEAFMKNLPVVNELKLRFETGTTGNSGGGQGYLAKLTSYTTTWGAGFLAGNYSNENFQWEPTLTYNLGLNLSLFDSRIQVDGDVYLRKTDKLIMKTPLPYYMGTSGQGSITAPFVNLGSMENRGYGVTITTVNINKSDFSWRSSLNISGVRNKLTKLYSESAYLDRTYWFMTNFLTRSQIGQPIWQFYGYVKEGIFQNLDEVKNSPIPKNNTVAQSSTWVGDVKYKDLNGDGIIDGQDQKIIGNPWPKFTAGFTNTFNYKGVELMVLLTASYGNQIFNYVRFKNENVTRINVGRNLLKGATNYARLETDDEGNPYVSNAGTTHPRIVASDANGNGDRATSDYIEDGSYLRVKNVQLSYSLPKSLYSRISGLDGVRIALGVQNLATFTKYKGYDPEVGAYVGNGSDPNSTVTGVDYGRYPLTRMYTFNLGIDF
ncbi:TonB-dependent receptor [Xanthocytophaga flavus]|nr:TonB-dependent receptor [Xanthocytophaga flavus]